MHSFRTFCILDVYFIAYSARYSLFVLMCRKTHITHSLTLTSCICKTLERMIHERLVWYLETNNIITEFQSGFRHQRSTNDHLVRLETIIREAFIKKEHLVAVFFDLEKAYDTTWKYGIMNDLHEIGLKGRLPIFVQNFLSNREFKVGWLVVLGLTPRYWKFAQHHPTTPKNSKYV